MVSQVIHSTPPFLPSSLPQDIAYTKLECVGRGGSSKVYKVMAPNRKIFALKRIRLTVRSPGGVAAAEAGCGAGWL